jgi:osmoprotectant transport system permease protein
MMDERWAAAWRLLPSYLGAHVMLSAAALVLGLVVSLPLAVLAVRSQRLRWPILAFASLVQTIPSLALLALFYPLLLALSALTQGLVGWRFSALGFLPSLLALTLYSMLPIVRNTVTGIVGIDRDILEAADGVGMAPSQRLWRVELPLATPMIMAGIRTAAVWVIGAATLSTPVGQTSLGNYIFAGLQLEDWVSVLFGCVCAAVLALVVDQALGQLEAGARRGNRRRMGAAIAALVLGVIVAAWPRGRDDADTYVVGAKNFSEQYILSALIGARLREQGAVVTTRDGLGSAMAFRALAAGDIDVYVDYSGTIWANVMQRTDAPPHDVLRQEMTEWLRAEHGVELVGELGFENAYALAMRRDRAAALGIHTIGDLATHAPVLQMGADFEFLARPEWDALRSQYGLAFAGQRQYQSTFMYKAVADGDVDVISAFSSDGRIAAFDLVVLEDPAHAIPRYDAIVLVTGRRAADPILRAALSPLLGGVPIAAMREANLRVDRDEDKQSPEAAAAWLMQHIDPPR